MKNIRIIIADDEAPARDELKHILSGIEGVEFLGEAKNGLEAIKLTEKIKPDVIFLDIEMPGLNGIEVAKKLIDLKIVPRIIFATAYDNYAVKAFEVNAIDYILKPFDEERIKTGILKAGKSLESSKGMSEKLGKILESFESGKKYLTKIPVKLKGKITLIDIEDIVYVKGEGGLVFVYENGREHLSDYQSLESLASELDPEKFFKTHRSYLVNISRMKEILPLGNGHYAIKCKTGKGPYVEIPLSRRQAKELKSRFKF